MQAAWREQRSHSQSSGDHWKPTKRYQTQLLKGTYTGGTGVDLYDLSGYASLGLWSIVPIFRPPKTMYCSIPYDAQEARSAIGFLMRFLLDPSNSTNLQSFHFSIWGVDPLPIMSELIKMQGLFCVLPLTRLCISGYGSAALLPSSITLRSGMSCGSYTLTSLHISSDLAFAPGLVRTTMGILMQSPIRNLAIYMVSLNPSQWSTLLGQLNMTLLEDIEVEGDIPRPALIRFLMKHRGLKIVRIGGKAPSDRTTQPSRSQNRCFLPNLRTLHAPLAICSDIIRRASDPSSLYELHAEVDQLRPHDHLFLHLVEALRRFQKLDHLGLRFVPSSSSAIPQASPEVDSWDGHPARELRQDMVCAYIQSFPTLQVVHVAEEGTAVRTELLESLRKASPTLRVVTISSGSFLKWTADAMD
ncbi:hypothetical protein EDB85DRAFT_1899918 [Lactarius pseudohatsudake]|nr:hypothetical protein EDB85DRAFT_1899918 [Lactarius pseudohatsudake]